MSREFNVTAGDAEYATVTVTERAGQSLEDATWEVGVGGYAVSERPASWTAGVIIATGDSTTSRVKVGLLIGPSGYTTLGTKRYLWVKVTDTPEHFATRVSGQPFDIV